MEIYRDRIRLRRICETDLELLRNWRNSEEVNTYMIYKGEITKEMQVTWFAGINNSDNLYFLIIVEDRPVGLIYGAEVRWHLGEVGNAGIYIAEAVNRENSFALSASLLLNDFAFSIGLQRIFIKVLADNIRAINYNKILGYRLLGAPEDGVSCFELERKTYLKARDRIQEMFSFSDTYTVCYNPGDQIFPDLNLHLSTAPIFLKGSIR